MITFKIQFDNSPGSYYEECADGFSAEAGLWKEICLRFENLFVENYRNDLIVCSCCGSFSISVDNFYKETRRFLSANDCSDEDEQLFELIGFLGDVERKITKEINCTDEEWLSYWNTGIPALELIFDDEGETVYAEEGRALTFVYKNVLFQLNAACESCSQTVFK
jgi:hypothetical protein